MKASRLGCATVLMCLGVVGFVADAAPATTTPKTPKDKATAFCRQQALARLKYAKTIEWADMDREESPAVWLITGVRTAKTPTGKTDQQYTCRVSLQAGTPQLKMIQIFKEASTTGKDIFEVH